MPEIIRNGRVETDDWTDSEVLTLAQWRERRAQPAQPGERLAVRLEPAQDPAELAADVERLRLVAIHFPKFADGRGYSCAVLLRTRYRYRGELRAVGDVGRDQLFYLKRCGFDAFALAPHRDPHAALASLGDFSVRYQGSVDDPAPLFRKRV
jgi:uncharacterized protein (DUF934 family)